MDEFKGRRHVFPRAFDVIKPNGKITHTTVPDSPIMLMAKRIGKQQAYAVARIALIGGRDHERAARLFMRIAEISKTSPHSVFDLVEEWTRRAYARDFPDPDREKMRRAIAKATQRLTN